jgi:hypothetical protein
MKITRQTILSPTDLQILIITLIPVELVFAFKETNMDSETIKGSWGFSGGQIRAIAWSDTLLAGLLALV